MCQTAEQTYVSEVDFRNLNPAQRQSRAFQIVGDLRAGEQFVLVNDHDPYLEQGPSVWTVEIAEQFKVA